MTYLKNFFKILISIFDDISMSSNINIKSNTILLVRLDAIGDFVLWLDSAKEFRRLYPDKKIILLSNSIWTDFARHFDYWDEVWPLELHSFMYNIFYRFKMIRAIRKASFEIAIQPTYSRFYLLGDTIIKATKASKRIGYDGDNLNIKLQDKSKSDGWYTQLINKNSDLVFELYRNAHFFETLSSRSFIPSIPIINIPSVLKKNLNFQGKYFIVFPGASWNRRMWEASKFADLINRLYAENFLTPVLCGSNSDLQVCKDIQELCNIPCVNLAGKSSIMELAMVIKNAEFLITNETSAVHLAVAVSTPFVCILGGGHYGRFMPYPEELLRKNIDLQKVVMNKMSCFGCQWSCIKDDRRDVVVPCISTITVDDVFNATLKFSNSTNLLT
jgi:ADP-heptose:LPS heptosyltransferase